MVKLVRKYLSQQWFDLIRDGIKTHEGRINDGFWKSLQVGDKFIFYNNDKEFCVEVAERLEF